MALNPQLIPNGIPVPFVHEMFVLARDGVQFEIDKIPGAQGRNVKAIGTVYLSNIHMVFVANKPIGFIFMVKSLTSQYFIATIYRVLWILLYLKTSTELFIRPILSKFCSRYVDPNDPTRIFLQQPNSDNQLRCRTYQPHNTENSI